MSLMDKLREGIWNIGIIEQDVNELLNGASYSIKWLKHSYKDRFFADPFLYSQTKDEYIVICEEYTFVDRKGKIVLLHVNKENFSLNKITPLISDEMHLSYPFLRDGMIIPEAYRGGGLFEYEVNRDCIIRKKISEFALIDPTWVKLQDVEYVFATTKENEEDAESLLSIFKYANGTLTAHVRNPIKRDIKTSRPGGMFFNRNGVLYRPAQDCEHFYGEAIRIMEVLELSSQGYVEREVLKIVPKGAEYSGLHTFNAYDNFIIVDGYKTIINAEKIIYTKFKGLYLFFHKNENRNFPKIITR